MTYLDRFAGPLAGWLGANLILSAQIGDKLDMFHRLEVSGCMLLAALSGAWWGWIRRGIQS